ncbi:transposase [Paenibacillus filicis]|uniref:Transposase n=1 Tax=Paenibacillus filicis TaxID=669464 RepID=A0ABU9DM13_9BACL
MPKQQRRTFIVQFKKQMVELCENGKSRVAIVEEYDLTASALDRWIKQATTTGFFKEAGFMGRTMYRYDTHGGILLSYI